MKEILRMRRFFAILLSFILILSLSACEPNKSSNLCINSLISDSFIDPLNGWKVYDDLINDIKAETDPSKRVELMHKAEDILMASGCVIPLYYQNDVYMCNSSVKNVYSNSLGYKYFCNCYFSNSETTLKLNLAGEPIDIDPAFCITMDSGTLDVNLFSGLYTIDKNGNTIPDLATGYTVSEPKEDGTVDVTVKMLKNLKWSNGSQLTAKDFEYSWKRAAKEETGSYNFSIFSIFAGFPDDIIVTATSDDTLEFTLNSPCPYIESLFAHPAFFPVHKPSVENYDSSVEWCSNAGFVSNGPFICTGWEHNESMTFEKNPYYYKESDIKLGKLEFTLSEQAKTVYKQYKSGELDFIDNIPDDLICSLSSNMDFYTVNILGTNYLSFNAKSDLFKNKTAKESACMRLAFNMLIDRKYIKESVGKRQQFLANSLIPIGIKDGNGGIFKATSQDNAYFDVSAINNSPDKTFEKARKYLVAAGFKFDECGKLSKETPIVIKYLTDDNSDNAAIAEIIKADFNELGINVVIDKLSWSAFIDARMNGDFDIARAGFITDINDPLHILEFFTTDSSANYCRFGNN